MKASTNSRTKQEPVPDNDFYCLIDNLYSMDE